MYYSLDAARTMLTDLLDKAGSEVGSYGPNSEEAKKVNEVLEQINK